MKALKWILLAVGVGATIYGIVAKYKELNCEECKETEQEVCE